MITAPFFFVRDVHISINIKKCELFNVNSVFQVDELQRSISHISEDKERVERDLEKKMIQIKELEIHYQAQFDLLQKELENIQEEMIAKKELASVANESLILKVSVPL